MNISHFPSQSNTRPGFFPAKAGENLVGMEGRLVKLSHTAGAPEFILPNDVADEADYLLLEGAAAGQPITVLALERGHNVRVRLDGTCNPGDKLTLAAIDGAKDGKVRTVPVAADVYWVALRAEEKGIADQLVLCRLLPNPGALTVT